MRKMIIILFTALSLLTLTSCDEVRGVLSIFPKFSGTLPNNIAGQFAYFDSDEAKKGGIYSRLYKFDSSNGTFTVSDEALSLKGTYTVSYKTYAITECNGTISFTFENGGTDELDFYFYATAVDGPEYLMLSDGRTYYYWGN